MIYVKLGEAAWDAVQCRLSGVAVLGLGTGDVRCYVQKAGGSYVAKVLVGVDWVELGGGNYQVAFSALELDTEGAFRFYVEPVVAGTFNRYDSLLYVVAALPTGAVDVPTISSTSPSPVSRGSSLVITGTNLLGAAVLLGGVPLTVTANTVTSVTATVPLSHSLGDQAVQVTTVGGAAVSVVEVVLNASQIPGDGYCRIYGSVFGTSERTFKSGIAVYGRLLGLPNISMGVGWTKGLTTVETDINGVFSIYMPRSQAVEIAIPETGYRRVFTVPDVVQANLFSEIP